MASNGSIVADLDGDYPDWVELYNAGTETVNLAGWGLSDNAEEPFRWVFPDFQMQAGEFLLVWASGKNRYFGTTTKEETIIAPASEWLYLDNGSNQRTSWREPTFDDSTWAAGPAPLGYSNQQGYATTVISYGDKANSKYITTYFRKRFTVTETTGISSLTLSLWIDDGAVVYLNGAELLRQNMTAGDFDYLTPTPTHVGTWPSWTHYELSPNVLQVGENVLAVEVHQTSGTSSDLGFDLRLLAQVPEMVLHTDFKISATGEPLVLTRPDMTVADAVSPTLIPRDVSFGRVTDGARNWGFFLTPTPAAGNNGSISYAEVLGEPQFSHPGGFYTAPFDLTLGYDDPEVTIYYTLDGSDPDPANLNGKTYSYKNRYPQNTGDTTLGPFLYRQMRTYAYGAPLPISDRSSQPYQIAGINTQFTYSTRLPQSNTFKATVVRARAYKDNAIPSRTITQSYFVNPAMPARYSVPVISIVTDEDSLFDYYTGIYVAGKVGDDWRLSYPWDGWNGGRPANYTQRGLAWERAAHIEFFDPDGSLMLAQDIGVRVHGGWSRSWYPKSLRLYARSEYDTEDTFDYPFFPGREKKGFPGTPLTSFQRLILRNAGNDHDQSFFRDALTQELVSHLSLDTMAYRPAVHFVNGEYWGVINIRERYDDEYIHDHYDINRDEVVILTGSNADVDTGIPTDRDHFSETVSYAQNNDISQAVHYNWIKERVDTDNLALYFAVQIYCNNRDWPQNNIDFWRKRTETYQPDAPAGHDGRWRWLLYDTDFGFGLNGDYTVNSLSRVMNSSLGLSNTLFNRLLLNADFRNTFINALVDNLNTSFNAARVNTLIDAHNAQLQPLRSEHNSRWQTGTGVRNEMKSFASQRPGYMNSYIQSAFNLSGTYTLTVARNENWGHVQTNSVLLDESTPGLANPSAPYPWSALYYKSVPITLRALPRLGYRFSHWMGVPSGVNPFDQTVTLTLSANTTITAVFEAPALMHYWSFNDPGSLLSPTYTLGGAVAAVQPGPTTEVRDDDGEDFAGVNNRLGEPTASHLRINNPIGSSLTFSLPTTGYEQVVLTFETRRSGKGAGREMISISTNGQTFTPYQTIDVVDGVPVPHTFNLYDVPGVDNNGLFAVRIEFAQGDGGTEGNNRIDNLTLEGIPMAGTNQPPKIIAQMPPRELIEQASGTMDLNGYFGDPDGDTLTYTVWTDKPFVAAPSISGSLLTLSALYRGDLTITVQAADGVNPPILGQFRTLVYPAAYPLRQSGFQFGFWSSQQPEHIFPEHMLFLQSDVSDPGLNQPLAYAYYIPHDDYHADDQNIIGYPYGTTGRTRLNGLEDAGIAFINTGRQRDLGGALLALDTTSVEAVDLTWLCRTLLQNTRQYAVRLQYRIGFTGPFTDVTADTGPVEYAATADGDTQAFGPVRLPDAAAGQPYVQVLWRYYYLSGTGGARSQLGLDDIAVSAPTFPYGGRPHPIPGRIEAESFDVGGQGVSYSDMTPGNSAGQFRPKTDVDIAAASDGVTGYVLDAIQDGEWLRYTVDSVASQASLYIRVASSQEGGLIRIRLDNDLLAEVSVPATGGLNTWQTLSVHGLTLPARQNAVLTLELSGTGYRVNWIDFLKREPFSGRPIPIPGRFEFEDYDIGGQQISYFDKTAGNSYNHYRSDDVDILPSQEVGGGYGVFIAAEEWLEYTCDILPGTYSILVRSSSSLSSQNLVLSVDGQPLTTFVLPQTGGYYTWRDTLVSDVVIPEGTSQVLRFTLENSSAMLNYVQFIRRYSSADITRSGRVDQGDFAVLASQWQGAPADPSADIAPGEGDGVVNLPDLLFLADNWLLDE